MTAREFIVIALVSFLTSVAVFWSTGCQSWQDPQGVQLSLGGDRKCSDPVFGQAAQQCCSDHDNCYWAGGTEADFHLCNHEFAACQLLWGVPPDIVEARFWGVEQYGRRAFRWSKHRTRGLPK